MDGIHDLGGMSGFGAVELERDEPVFHQPWERLAFALNALGAVALRAWNAHEYRHAVERMDPAHYLAATYYERWLTGVATLYVEKGFVTCEELEARAGGRFPLARPAPPAQAREAPSQERPRFALGDAVVVRDFHPGGHTRAPRYVRGKRGAVVRVAPRFELPDAAAHGRPGLLKHTYHVEFAARELWADAAGSNETVIVDLWDDYLAAAT